MKLMNVKGTYDYSANDMKLRNHIMDTLRKNFELYGYTPLETPILNYYDLLSYKYSDEAEILSEIYHLTDQGERNLGLRYDLTVPFCKYVGLTKELSIPFRRYEIGKVFRNGPVKAGRTREFYQCDVDCVGIDNRYIEAEQILMAINTYKELGIDAIVKYNNRKLMSGLIKEAGIEETKIDSVIGIVDKMEKVEPAEIKDMLLGLAISDATIGTLYELFTMNKAEYQNLATKNPLVKEGLDELLELETYLDKLGITTKCEFVPTLARGLSIYTGIVYEFYDSKYRITSAIGGGGRYDKIITNFMDNGVNYPAVGLSFGLEPIFVLLREGMNKQSMIDIYMVPLDTFTDTLNLATKLRSKEFNVLIEMNKKKISKCFEYAEREHIRYVMIIGENEISTGNYKIKDMTEKVEYSLTESNLIDFLNERA